MPPGPGISLPSSPLRNGSSAKNKIPPSIDFRPNEVLSPAMLKQIAEALRHVVREELRRPLVDNPTHQPLPAPGQHGEPLPAGACSEVEPRVSVGQLITTTGANNVGFAPRRRR